MAKLAKPSSKVLCEISEPYFKVQKKFESCVTPLIKGGSDWRLRSEPPPGGPREFLQEDLWGTALALFRVVRWAILA
jgi:hypothetical protein